MKVLYVNLRPISKNTSSGGEAHIIDLLNGFEGKRMGLYIFYPRGEKSYVFDWSADIEYEYAGKATVDTFSNNIIEESFKRIIREFSIDVVHFENFQTLPLSLLKIPKDEGKKTVITVHDYFLWCDNFTLLSPICNHNKLSFCSFEKKPSVCSNCLTALAFHSNSAEYVVKRRNVVNDLIGNIDKFVFPSEYPKDVFLSLYENIPSSKCRVIEHGINKVPIETHDHFALARKSLNVAFLGAFRKHKGSDAFQSLVDAFGRRGDIRFFIFGQIEEGINTASAHLHFTGKYERNNLPSLLGEHQIDVILLLSPWPETYSYTLTEAIISGIPVISTDLGALRERVSKYFAGWLVPCEDPVGKVKEILESIICDRDILAFFRERSAESAKRIPTIAEMSQEYIELYRGLK